MPAISTVIFDLGRVLVNIDFDAFPNALGLTTSASREPYRREVAAHAHLFETGRISTQEFQDRLHAVFAGRFTREFLLFAWNEIIRDDVPGMAELVARVQSRASTAMLSNTSMEHFAKAERDCATVRMIGRRFLSFEIGEAKPAPGIYRSVINGLRAEPSQLLFIDDLAENVDAALEAGMNALLFTDPARLERDLIALAVLPPILPA